MDALVASWQLLRPPNEAGGGTARAVWDALYKELALVDLTQPGRLGVRWRGEGEVLSGKGFTVCGSVTCDSGFGLRSFEVPFAYTDGPAAAGAAVPAAGSSKLALVKVRLCTTCAPLLFAGFAPSHEGERGGAPG